MSQPLGFLRVPSNMRLYRSMLLLLMASSKVIIIICGTFLRSKLAGIPVPSSEQKQSGSVQPSGSHTGARLGSDSKEQEFSSEPSLQSGTPLQKASLSRQVPSWQANWPSWHRGSSVLRIGFNLRSCSFCSQFLTADFQSHVCFSMSKAKPAGQRMACKPLRDHWDNDI